MIFISFNSIYVTRLLLPIRLMIKQCLKCSSICITICRRVIRFRMAFTFCNRRVYVYKQVAIMAPGTTMPRFGAIELFWPRGSACVRYSENYLIQEVDERGSVSMLSGCATRGFFSVLATIRLKPTPFPLFLTQYVPSPSAKLAQLSVNWQIIKK